MANVHCTVCDRTGLERSLEFGPQPLSTKFGRHANLSKFTIFYDLSIGHCKHCHTIQLIDRFPLDVLQGKDPAVRFREPSAHLPQVLAKLQSLKIVRSECRIAGLSYIDRDLLDLIQTPCDGIALSLEPDGKHERSQKQGLETLQSLYSTVAYIDDWTRTHGRMDFISARFILEHAESALHFLKSIKRSIRSGGYLLIEVPDARKIIASMNHALIWEDHFTYFTADTLTYVAQLAGYSIVDLQRYPYPYEDSLVAILRAEPKEILSRSLLQSSVAHLAIGLEEFSASFSRAKTVWQQALSKELETGRKLAIFGAGHHAVKFVNFYSLGGFLECAIDDNPTKSGMYLAGTKLQIRSSAALNALNIRLCLSSLNPTSEAGLRTTLPDYFARGGEFRPCFVPNWENYVD